jgi:hypothetical protein
VFGDIEYLSERDLAAPAVTELFERLRRQALYAGALPLDDATGIARGRDLFEGAR